jgi:hypothetical protein
MSVPAASFHWQLNLAAWDFQPFLGAGPALACEGGGS